VAARAAISDSFSRFDTDNSGKIDRQEFQQAMHTLGLRVSDDEYDVLFKKCDSDGSGEISLDEFSHMIKGYLGKACTEGECRACEVSNGSNQPETVYRPRWADDSSLLSPAASTLQAALLASTARDCCQERLGAEAGSAAPLSPSPTGDSTSSPLAADQDSAQDKLDVETGLLDDIAHLEEEKARLQRAKECIEAEKAVEVGAGEVEGGATEMSSGVAAGSCNADELSKAVEDELSKAVDEMNASLGYAQRLQGEAQRYRDCMSFGGEQSLRSGHKISDGSTVFPFGQAL